MFDFLVNECEKRALKFKPIETDTLQDKQAEFNPEEYAAKKMLQISEADKIKQNDREANTMNTREKLIDNNNYSPTIEDFKEKALIESLDTSNPAQYLKFLRKEKERYTNGKYYYQIHGNSKAESDFENAYGEILVFIKTEISGRLDIENLQPETKPTVNVFCKAMPLDFAISHFKVFTEKNSKNGRPFLSCEQLNSFIERAFYGNSKLPQLSFNLDTKEKMHIVKRFYDFYFESSKQYENTSQCQDKYIRLLTDNFSNWQYSSIKNNFSKKPKKQYW